jgi:pimeloyl-ACP methyl ester carboxylesterase
MGLLPRILMIVLLFGAGCSAVPDEARRSAAPLNYHFAPGSSQKLILFVHGLFGDPISTWTNDNGQSWMGLMAGDPAFRDFTVATIRYDTPLLTRTSTLEEIATRSLRRLEDEGVFRNYNEIYFIAHSMGGLLVKRMLVNLNRPGETEKLRRVKAVLYISTPAQGANLADLASWLSLNPQLDDMRVADLNSFLQALENQWQDLIRDRGNQIFPRSFCAYETKPTHGTVVVSRVYAATYCDQNPIAVDEDHSGIVKPYNRQADIYVWARARIQETSKTTGSSARKTVFRVEINASQGTAKVGDSKINQYNSSHILILTQDAETGAGIPSLAPSNIGKNDASGIISLPAGWNLETYLVPAGGCSLKPTHLLNDGKGNYLLNVTSHGEVSCPWLKGEYHFRLDISVDKYEGRSLGRLIIN